MHCQNTVPNKTLCTSLYNDLSGILIVECLVLPAQNFSNCPTHRGVNGFVVNIQSKYSEYDHRNT